MEFGNLGGLERVRVVLVASRNLLGEISGIELMSRRSFWMEVEWAVQGNRIGLGWVGDREWWRSSTNLPAPTPNQFTNWLRASTNPTAKKFFRSTKENISIWELARRMWMASRSSWMQMCTLTLKKLVSRMESQVRWTRLSLILKEVIKIKAEFNPLALKIITKMTSLLTIVCPPCSKNWRS